MNLAELKKAQVREETLANGLDVKIKDIGMMDLAMDGEIPDTLSGLFDEAMSEEVSMSDLPKFGELVNFILVRVIVEPSLSDDVGDENYINNFINARDRMTLFSWANREADSLHPFREEEKKSVGAA